MLTIGYGQRDFTPDRPAMLQGQKRRRIATEAMDPLTLTAMVAAGDGGEAVGIVSLDLPFPTESMLRRVRQAVGERVPELAGERIVLLATHTHTSVVTSDEYYDAPDDSAVMTPAACETRIVDAAIDALLEAWSTKTDAKVARAFGHAVVGHNRHAVYADGHAQMYGQTNRDTFTHVGGYEDHSVDMLFTWSDGELTGVVLIVPCPSQVTENLEVFSADYWHEARVELRKRFGEKLQVLGICGAAGDQSPHFILYKQQEQEMRERRGVSERQEIALRLADAVERALVCASPTDVPGDAIRHVSKRVELTPRQVSAAERDWAAAEHERCVAAGDATSWWPTRLKQVVDQFEGRWTPDPYACELQALRIGDLAMTACPFELFLDYALRIKARSVAPQTAVAQLSGMGYYLPSARGVEGGGYGAMPAVSLVGPEGGEELVEHSLQMIESLF